MKLIGTKATNPQGKDGYSESQAYRTFDEFLRDLADLAVKTGNWINFPQRYINEYVRVDQENWSRYRLEILTKVILVAYSDGRLEEAKSLVESLQNEIVNVLPKYLDRAEFGMGSSKA